MTTNEQVALVIGWRHHEGDEWYTSFGKVDCKIIKLPDFATWVGCGVIVDWCDANEIYYEFGNNPSNGKWAELIKAPYFVLIENKDSIPEALCLAVVAWAENQCKGCKTQLNDVNRHYMDARYCGMCGPEKENPDA